MEKRERERERKREREKETGRERDLHANAPSVKEKVFNEFFLSTATVSSVMSLQHAHRKPLVLLLFTFKIDSSVVVAVTAIVVVVCLVPAAAGIV